MKEKKNKSQLEIMKRSCNRFFDKFLDISSVYFFFFLTYQLFFYRTIFFSFSSLKMSSDRSKIKLNCFKEKIQKMRAFDIIDDIVN